VLSQPVKNLTSDTPNPKAAPREYTRAEIQRSGDKFQLSMYTKKQVFHSNFTIEELKTVVDGLFGITFTQYHAWDETHEYTAKISKKGKVLTSRNKAASKPRTANFAAGSFDRQKNHIIKEGENIPALADMGVFTKEGKVVAGMRDKLNQINRFLELMADETGPSAIPGGTTVNIVDFGCGKSYLTFLVYHYFTVVRKQPVNICGLDLNPSIIEACTKAAVKYGYTSLFFILGEIGKQNTPPLKEWGKIGTFNIIISLHACDTATDYVLSSAVKWNADLIYAVPCCQHELRSQMKPRAFDILSGYGIIEERFAVLATDAIRAKLLEYVGYNTQIIEFTDIEHTTRNLMIRAKRTNSKSPKALEQVKKLLDEFGFEPTLMKLLQIY